MSIIRMIVVLGLLMSLGGPVSVSAQFCVGDCDGDGAVTVDEIVRGVAIALGTVSVDDCLAFDPDGSRSVTVDELVKAVNNALSGCPTACDLSGSWRITATQVDPPEPPEVIDVEFTQDELGRVTVPGFPAFQGRVLGDVFRIDFCDCSPEELLCDEADAAIASDCDSFSGILEYLEFGSVLACETGDPNQSIGSGRENVEATRRRE